MPPNYPIRSVFAVLLISAASSNAFVIADLRGDYDASTRVDGVAASITDTQGSGVWTFDARDTATVGAVRSELLYSTTANAQRNANAYVLSGQSLDLPGISNSQLIAGPGEGIPAPNQLALHPGEFDQTFPFLGIRWTPGAAEYGAATISGSFQDIGVVGDGTTILILDQSGSTLFSHISNGSVGSFNFATTLSGGSFIDFIIGYNTIYFGDQSAINITIEDGVTIGGIPEPSTAALLLGTSALCLLRRKRR